MSFGLDKEVPLPGDVSIPYEARPYAMWSWERIGYFHNALAKFARMMDGDFYAPPGTYRYLNSASLPNPVERVRNDARCVFELWSRGELSENRKQQILDDARREAAALVNLQDHRGVVLCRNASEALSYFLWLSDVMEGGRTWSPEISTKMVLSTDVENPSIQREIFIIKDHSNADRSDSITTYPEFASQRPLNYKPPAPHATGLRWGHFEVARVGEIESLLHLHEFMKEENPSVLILSHVLRTTGRELPIAEWIKKAREWKVKYHPESPDLFVCIDGAQALGNINVDINTLDCDMYVGCGQKALQGETVGLLYVNPDNPRIRAGMQRVRDLQPDTQVTLRGMFHDDWGVTPNVDDDISYADIAGFNSCIARLKAIDMVRGNDFSSLAAHRTVLRDRCAEGLMHIKKKTGLPIELLDEQNGTSFIFAFRIGKDPFMLAGGHRDAFSNPEGIFEPGAMHNLEMPTESPGKTIAQNLYKNGVGIAFLRRGNIFRVSFSEQTTYEDVEGFLLELEKILIEY